MHLLLSLLYSAGAAADVKCRPVYHTHLRLLSQRPSYWGKYSKDEDTSETRVTRMLGFVRTAASRQSHIVKAAALNAVKRAPSAMRAFSGVPKTMKV